MISDLHDDRLDLSFLEALLLWAVRADASSHGPEREALCRATLRRALDRAGMLEAEPYLLGFLWALQHGALRRPALHAFGDPRISTDERSLLDAPGLVHAGRGIEAVLLLRSMMTPAAVRAALTSLERLAALADAAGHPPCLPERGTTRFLIPPGGTSRQHVALH